MHRHVERNFGHPVDGIACIATTRELRSDSPMVIAMVAAEMIRNPDLAMRDFECIALGRPDSYFSPLVVDACKREETAATKTNVSGASDLAFVSDGCAQVIVELQGDRVVQVFESFVEPTATSPLQPSIIRLAQADAYIAHGCRNVSADVHEWASLCETLVPQGIQVTHAPTGQAITTAFALTRDLMRQGRLEVLPRTAEQLKRVQTGQSGSPQLVRRTGEGHCDLVSALVQAVWLDRRHGPMGGSGGEKPGSLRGGWTT
jgi:hypothetical protein